MAKTILFTFYFPFYPSFGGIQRVSDLLAKALLQKGYKVLYLSLKKPSEVVDYTLPCEAYYFPHDNDFAADNHQFYRRFLADHQVDIVINQAGAFAASQLFLDTGNPNIKRISVIHSSPLMRYKAFASEYFISQDSSGSFGAIKEKLVQLAGYFKEKSRVLRRLKRQYALVGKESEVVCILSASFQNELKKLQFTAFDKLQVLPNPNSYTHYLLPPSKRNIVLYVGRLVLSEKRVDRLLKVWKNIYSQFPNWELVLVGDGEDKPYLEKKASQWGLERIHFPGRQNKPEVFYQQASILCLTSNFEGFPMVIAEAQQHGAVPIAFDSFASAQELVQHNKTGILVKSFNIRQYQKELGRLMANQKTREEMAKRGIEEVKKYDINTVCEKWIQLLEA